MVNSWLVAKLATPIVAFSGWMVAFPELVQDEHQGHAPPPPAWVAAMDLDDNGEISADELSRASESLKKLDKNEDGKLDHEELRPHPGPGRHDQGHGPGDRGPGGPGGGGPGFGGPREDGPGFGGPRRGGPGFGGPGFGGPGFGGPGFGGPGFGGPRGDGPGFGGPREDVGQGPGKPENMRREPGRRGPAGQRPIPVPSFEQLDTNGDGNIDREEYKVIGERQRPPGRGPGRGEGRGEGRKSGGAEQENTRPASQDTATEQLDA